MKRGPYKNTFDPATGNLRCNKCGYFLHPDMFYPDCSCTRGRQYACIKCMRIKDGAFKTVLDSIADYHAGKVLLKEVCADHGLSISQGTRIADKVVNSAFTIPDINPDKNEDIYLTSRMTVEQYVVFIKANEESPYYHKTMPDLDKKKVYEFLNEHKVTAA